MTDVLKT